MKLLTEAQLMGFRGSMPPRAQHRYSVTVEPSAAERRIAHQRTAARRARRAHAARARREAERANAARKARRNHPGQQGLFEGGAA